MLFGKCFQKRFYDLQNKQTNREICLIIKNYKTKISFLLLKIQNMKFLNNIFLIVFKGIV